MERYLIFRLGLAILFYAAYCVRPMNCQETDDDVGTNNTNPGELLVFYQGVEGIPGVDFPILSHIPRTTFNCKEVESGYYADLDTDCQVFHICEEGKKISFLCPNGTIFQQSDLICEWWFKVNCTNSPNLYEESAEQYRDAIIRRKASRRVFQNGEINHGAVLRTEEQSSVSAMKHGKHVEYNVERHETHRNQQRNRQRVATSNHRGGQRNRVVEQRQGDGNYKQDQIIDASDKNLGNDNNNYVRINQKPQSRKNIKLTLSTANNAVSVNGRQQSSRTGKKTETNKIKLTLSNVNNQVSLNGGVSENINGIRNHEKSSNNGDISKNQGQFNYNNGQVHNQNQQTSVQANSNSLGDSNVDLGQNNQQFSSNKQSTYSTNIHGQTTQQKENSYNSLSNSNDDSGSSQQFGNNHKVSFTQSSISESTGNFGNNQNIGLTSGKLGNNENIGQSSHQINGAQASGKLGNNNQNLGHSGSQSSQQLNNIQYNGKLENNQNIDNSGSLQINGNLRNNQNIAHSNGQSSQQGSNQNIAHSNGQSSQQGNNQNIAHSNGQSSQQVNNQNIAHSNGQSSQQGNNQNIAHSNGQLSQQGNNQNIAYSNGQSSQQGNNQNAGGLSSKQQNVDYSVGQISVKSKGKLEATHKVVQSSNVPTSQKFENGKSQQHISFTQSSNEQSSNVPTSQQFENNKSQQHTSFTQSTVEQSSNGPAIQQFENNKSQQHTSFTQSTVEHSSNGHTSQQFDSNKSQQPTSFTQSTITQTSSGPTSQQFENNNQQQHISFTQSTVDQFSNNPTSQQFSTSSNQNSPSTPNYNSVTNIVHQSQNDKYGSTLGPESFVTGGNTGKLNVEFDNQNYQQQITTHDKVPTNRGGFKYNEKSVSPQPNIVTDEDNKSNNLGSSGFVNNKVIAKEIQVEIKSNNNDGIEVSSSTIAPLALSTVSKSEINEYDLEFPKHASEKVKEGKKIDFESKGEIKPKQKSTVPLTRNDLLYKRIEPSDSDETQITQESSSFIKSSFNTIQDNFKLSSPNPYPNHRTTYSELKQPNFSNGKFVSTINSVTPQYITTQSINNGKPFVGSRVGTTISGIVPANPTKSYESVTEKVVTQNLLKTTHVFNTGATSPSAPTTTPVPVKTDLFNVGKTDYTIKPVLLTSSYTKEPLSIFVPNKFNLGLNSSVQTVQPTQSSKAIENSKLFNLGLGSVRIATTPLATSTKKPVDHEVVYGTFVKNEKATTQPSFDINQGVQIKFDKNSNKVGIQLSKTIGGHLNVGTTAATQTPKVYVNEGQSSISTPSVSPAGFFVTRDSAQSTPNPISSTIFNLGTESSNYYGGKNNILKPRPFEKHEENSGKFGFEKGVTESVSFNSVTPTAPTYKISSASPFSKESLVKSTLAPTLPTPLVSSRQNSVYENVDNMINVLMEIAKVNGNDNYESETPRPGLVVPPSAGPQTLHTLAVYFANALDGIAAEKERIKNEGGTSDTLDGIDISNEESMKESLKALLTQMTINKYNELFNEKLNETVAATVETRLADDEGKNGLKTDNSNSFVETPHIRQLARNFSIALSSYLDDPESFRRDLQELRPTEPPLSSNEQENTTEVANADEELLNFSDADSKSSYPPIFPTAPSVSPTWGYILAGPTKSNLDVKNSLNPDLQGADSQSFIPRFNNIVSQSKTQSKIQFESKSQTELPSNHWTTSPDATKLWKSTFGVNPISLNQQFVTTESIIPNAAEDTNDEENVKEEYGERSEENSSFEQPHHEIKYELRTLPKISLNSTQVHGILIDFMNTTNSDDGKLQRILHKLNTTEGEFISKMKEIESNPLTKRLILLLISECGANITKDIPSLSIANPTTLLNIANSENLSAEDFEPSGSKFPVSTRQTAESTARSNSNLKEIVDPTLEEDDHDARALQLLNSLYTIASRFGK